MQEGNKPMNEFELLDNPELFTPYKQDGTGVTCYILNRKVAPVQQSFYFVNDGMSRDGRYLWFYCAFPPSGGRSLGLIDFVQGEVRHYPETQFDEVSPYVDPDTGEVFWGMGAYLWKRGPHPEDGAQLVNRIPEEVIGGKYESLTGRPIHRLATHLTRSADGKQFFVDSSIGTQYIFGTLPTDGGDYEHWHTFNRNHNHAIFSPVDPNQVLYAQELHNDTHTGLTYPITNRLWTLKRGQEPRPVLTEPEWVTHEWWDADGEHVWCVRGNETWRVHVQTGDAEKMVFPHSCWHSHSSVGGEYIVSDSNDKFYRGCPSSVYFLNRTTGNRIKLVQNPERNDYTGRMYHIDPHPRFCGNDQYVVFTTTVRGRVDVAIVKTRDLIERTT